MYNIILFIGAILILFVFLKLIGIPTKTVFKFVLNSLLGGLIVFLLFKFGNNFGLDITINGVTSIVVGALGIPGAVIMVVLQVVGILA